MTERETSMTAKDGETFPHALAGYLTRNGQVGNLPDCQREIEDFMRAKPESAPSAPAVNLRCQSCNRDLQFVVCPTCGRDNFELFESVQEEVTLPPSAAPESDTRGEVTADGDGTYADGFIDGRETGYNTCGSCEHPWYAHTGECGAYMKDGSICGCTKLIVSDPEEIEPKSVTLPPSAEAELESERASNLLLREENERLRAAKDDAIYFQDRVKEIGFADTDEVKHAKEDLARMREDLATLRASASSELQKYKEAAPIEEWHDDMGSCLWWDFPICEPPYVGSPDCDDWPGYHTHFTRLTNDMLPSPRITPPTATNPEKADRSQG